MKIIRYILAAALLAAALPLTAAVQKGTDHLKTQIKPEGGRVIPDLRNAGPIWKSVTPLRTTSKQWGTLQRAVRPDETVMALATEHGLKVHELQFADNGTLSFISGELGGAAQLKSASTAARTLQSAVQSTQALRDLRLAQQWLETFAPALKLDQPVAELALSRYETDALGMRHLRLQQFYRGLPVWANELYVHLDAGDQVYAVNGRYAPTPAAINPASPGISGEQAIASSRAHLAAAGVLREIPAGMTRLLRFSAPTSTRAIWIDKENLPHLVWQVDIYANIRDWFTLMVDAASGEVLHKYSNTMSEGEVDASGVDLSGATRTFRAYEQNGTYYMLSDINELAGGAANLPENPTGGMLVLDLRNTDPSETSQYYFVTSSSRTSWNDKSAISAMYNLNTVYAYYKNTFSRRAIDDKASTIITVVNVTEDGRTMDNAYWNGAGIFWGNGAEEFSPLAEALDVAAHELTHGVTEYSANLVYQDQPGALNESFSDVFGAMIDRDDWLMGEDIMLPGKGSALRDMANPGNPNVLSQLPGNMDEYVYTSDDNGGVHTNSGIPNKAAYLIATSIGREKTERIYYRALTTYLTRQSQFIDARAGLEQSATDLYGSGAELAAVQSAFDAVKITKSGSGGTTSRGAGANEVDATTGGHQWIAFVRDDLQIGLYDVVNKVDYYFPYIYVKSKQYNWTQFSVTADGHYLYFVNADGVLARIDISGMPNSYYYETFPQFYIKQAGDLWNSSVSRDGQYVALTSTYEDDNNLYVIISGEIYYLPLLIPSTQEGISRMTIQYPDVLNWSPNTKYPKLAFDAYNQYTLSNGTTRDWWSMGEVDFTGDQLQVYSLLPAQPEGVSVGNVQYSSTDPDRVAYSYIDEANNYWDIVVVNFAEANQNQRIQFPARDVERPSFSPDDQYLVVDRYSDSKLLVLNIASLSFSTLNLSTGARYPEWFVIGGSYDLDVAAKTAAQPAGFNLEAAYPNPFNTGTTIRYTLPRSGRIHLAIYDLQGRLVRTLADEVQSAGQHSLNWSGNSADGQALPSGVYFCRMEAEGGFRASQKMVMVK
ncbi:MAG TPA: M4 family metallopeptidase [bacterium]|nr:M4 family metallopeptidase [bacterium]HQJ66198.1 M4 family metallopeptidase [bacterium]